MDRCRKTAQPKRESTEKALGEGRRVQDRLTARFGLITSDDNVDIKWIDFYSATSPAGALCRDECRARAQEGIEDNLAAGVPKPSKADPTQSALGDVLQGKVISM